MFYEKFFVFKENLEDGSARFFVIDPITHDYQYKWNEVVEYLTKDELDTLKGVFTEHGDSKDAFDLMIKSDKEVRVNYKDAIKVINDALMSRSV